MIELFLKISQKVVDKKNKRSIIHSWISEIKKVTKMKQCDIKKKWHKKYNYELAEALFSIAENLKTIDINAAKNAVYNKKGLSLLYQDFIKENEIESGSIEDHCIIQLIGVTNASINDYRHLKNTAQKLTAAITNYRNNIAYHVIYGSKYKQETRIAFFEVCKDIKGIGVVIYNRIMKAVATGVVKHLDDLINVKGIGEKTSDRIKLHYSFNVGYNDRRHVNPLLFNVN